MRSVQSEGKYADESYSIVKSLVIRGNILSTQTLEDLAESKSLEEFLMKMKGTNYSRVISELQPKYSSQKIEMVFRRHLVDIYQEIIRVSPKKYLLSAYYLKFVARNLKTLLRGRAQGKPEEEISRHLDMHVEEKVGRHDMLVRALAAENLDQTVEVLSKGEFVAESKSAVDSFKKTGKFQVFDIYIDKAVYNGVVGAYFSEHGNEKSVRDIVAVDVDSYNILTALRGKMWNLAPSEIKSLMIESYFDVSRSNLKKMIEVVSISEAMETLKSTKYRKLVDKVDLKLSPVGRLEDEFGILGYRKALNPFLWDIRGTSLTIGAVKLCEMEVRNLSTITVGIEQHLDSKEILSRLISLKK